MVLGVTRARPEAGERRALSMRPSAAGSSAKRDWLAVRGKTRWGGAVDLVGGFPGFGALGGWLGGGQLRLTDRYLLVNEGRARGFGLALEMLDDAHVVQTIEGGNALRLRYRDGDDGAARRSFTIRFRAPLLSLRSDRRAEHALAALRSVGIGQADPRRAPVEPPLAVSWGETRQFEQERVIWSGRATAPLGLGFDRAGCDVWLTTRSLIWGSGTGDGVYRLPLAVVRDVVPTQLEDRAGTPALFLGLGDEAGWRYDLAFIFDRHSPAERNVRERGACLVGLRSRGIPLGMAGMPTQPWRLDVRPAVDLVAVPIPAVHVLARDGVPTARRGCPAEPVEPAQATSTSAAAGPPAWDTWPAALDGDDVAAPAAAAAPVPAVSEMEPGFAAVSSLPEPASTDWLGDAHRGRNGHATDEEDVQQPAIEPRPGFPSTDPDPRPRSPRPGVAVVEADGAAVPDVAEAEFPAPAHQATGGGLGRPDTRPAVSAASDLKTVFAPDRGVDVGTASAAAPDPGLPLVRAYEAAALGVLAEALREIDRRAAGGRPGPLMETLPPPAQQTAALAELMGLTASGVLTTDQAWARQARMEALGEAGSRLRALLELRDAGHLSDVDLTRKRTAITAHLSNLIVPVTTRTGVTTSG